jgi:hypothetical protein
MMGWDGAREGAEMAAWAFAKLAGRRVGMS